MTQGSLGLDLVRRANANSGWQLCFAQKFTIWLYFEKWFLFPTLSVGRKLSKAFMARLLTSVQPPSFVNTKNRARYNTTLMKYWKETCTSQHFEVLATEERGFYVISKTGNYKMLQKLLVGRTVHLNQRHTYCLRSAGYNSLFEFDDGTCCILYGPLQFVNHSCSSDLKLKIKQNKSFYFIHEYDQERDAATLVPKNEEILLWYTCKKKLWFSCQCIECVT